MGEEHLTAGELLERTDMTRSPRQRPVTPAELEDWLKAQGSRPSAAAR